MKLPTALVLPSRRPLLALAAGLLTLALPLVAHADSGPNHRVRQDPVLLGTSGGNINDFDRRYCYGGTLGALVQKDGVPHILSNNHVLARSNKAVLGEGIVQPGLIDVACKQVAADVVGTLSTFTPISFSTKASNVADAALALVTSTRVPATGYIMDIGTVSGTTATDVPGCTVKKSGRTTGLTTGAITAVDVTVTVSYGGRLARFVDQFLVSPGAFSAGGDSGSLIVRDEATTPRAVGLLFAGSSSYTIGNPIAGVLGGLGASMAGATGGGSDCPPAQPSSGGGSGKAQDVKRRHEDRLLALPDVVGVGVGQGDVIEVYLARNNPRTEAQVPDKIEDVPVRVVVTGAFEAR